MRRLNKANTFANHKIDRGLGRKVIAIAGGKGGVGKTIITAAMGMALAEKGIRTVVMDADFGGANLHQAMGIIAPPLTIRDFIRHKEPDLNRLLLETSFPNLRLLAGSSDFVGGSDLEYSTKQRILRNLKNIETDCLLLDIGAGAAFDQLDFFNASDVNIVVITPEPLSVQDGYNFVKLALFRKLYRSFRHIDEIRLLFDQLYNSPDMDSATFYRRVENCFAGIDDFTREHWHYILENYQPALIVNMVESEKDREEGVMLQYAVQDILKVSMRMGGAVRFDNSVRRAVRKLEPELLLAKDGQAANNIRAVVETVLFSHGQPNKNWYDSGKQNIADNQVICSVNCSLWDSCSVRNGGFVCRIQAVGYISQIAD